MILAAILFASAQAFAVNSVPPPSADACAAAVSAEPGAATTPAIDHLMELARRHRFIIPAAVAEETAEGLGVSVEGLMALIIQASKPSARPPISKYRVAAVGRLRGSGDLVVGVNLEFPGHPLSETVHGEQFVVALAHNQGLGTLDTMVISAEPCGGCRQWLYEIDRAAELRVLVADRKGTSIPRLLPRPFGPADLSIASSILASNRRPQPLILAQGLPTGQRHAFGSLSEAALNAATRAYAPYTQGIAAVAIETADGAVFTGSAMENAAFNPSLSPLQSALTGLVAAGRDYDEIRRVVVADPEDLGGSKPAYRLAARNILSTIAPLARMQVILVKPAP